MFPSIQPAESVSPPLTGVWYNIWPYYRMLKESFICRISCMHVWICCMYVHAAKHIFVCVCLCVCTERGLAGLGRLLAGIPCGEEEDPQNQVISLPRSLQRPPIPWASYTARGLKRTTLYTDTGMGPNYSNNQKLHHGSYSYYLWQEICQIYTIGMGN